MLLTEYLEQHGIRYWNAGSKNVGKGYVGIQCVFCSDNSNHLGIGISTGSFRCLKCGKTGNFYQLLLRLGESKSSSREIARKMVFSDHREHKVHVITGSLQWLMDDFQSPIIHEHRLYLEQRGYDPDLFQKKYRLFSSTCAGKFNHKLIIPVIMQRKIVGFIGRDVTGRAKLRYKSSPDTHNLTPRRRWLFNIDSVKNGNAILVEGPMDAMNLGDGAVAMLSTSFSNEQVVQLASMKLKNVFVMFDGEDHAIRQAHDLAYRLAPFVENVEVIEMPEGKDPGDMTREEVKTLRREILQ